VLLAGEHTSTAVGYLEGAVQSGHRAADALGRLAS
jgi:monoamine oxidase